MNIIVIKTRMYKEVHITRKFIIHRRLNLVDFFGSSRKITSIVGGHYRDHYFNQIFPQNAIFWEIADAHPRGERVRRYYEINLVIAWPRKKSGRSVLIKELEASAAPCQRLSFLPFLSFFFYPCIATDIVYVYVVKLAELMKKMVLP